MVRRFDVSRAFRFLPILALIVALGLAASPTAWAAGPELDPHGLRAAPQGETGNHLGPNG